MEKVTNILYDLFVHFGQHSSQTLGFIAFNHYPVPISIEFTHCLLEKCLSDLGLGERIHEVPTKGFRALRFSGNQPTDSKWKWKRLKKIVGEKSFPPFSLSVREAPLELVLFQLLQQTDLKFSISNGIRGTISMHLKHQDPLKIIHLILVYYGLEMQKKESGITLVPKEEYGSKGYRVRSAP